MSNWQQIPLADCFSFTKKDRNTIYSDFDKIPFVPMELVPQGKAYFSDYELRDSDKIKSGTYFENGDLLLAKITPSFENGKQGIAQIDKEFGIATTEVIPIKSITGKSSIEFLFFYLLDQEVRNYLAGSMEGSTGRQRIGISTIKNLIISFPPLKTQKQIAQILSTLQSKVELVDKQIKLYEELKKSTMEKLFSEGLHGEKKKETEIGLIPESWEVKKFDNLCVLQRGKDLPKRDFIDGKIPVAGSNGVIGYHNKFTTEAIGVTVGRSGSVGKTSIYFTNFWAHNTVLYVKDFFENDRVFTYYYLDYLNLQKYSSGVSVPTLNRNAFSSILISIPPFKEQKEISDILEKLDQKINKLTSKKKSYQQLFNSMLHKLMNQEIEVDKISL